MSEQGTPEPLVCAGCGAVIGGHERVWIEYHGGMLQASSMLDLDEVELLGVARLWHGGCTVPARR